MRYDFGDRRRRPRRAVRRHRQDGRQVRRLSRAVARRQEDGRRGRRLGTTADILLLDVATKTPHRAVRLDAEERLRELEPDGSAYVGVFAYNGATNYNLMLFDGTTGAVDRERSRSAARRRNPTNHPDWSPHGDRIAYVNVGVNERVCR